jgi:hypothetical protein
MIGGHDILFRTETSSQTTEGVVWLALVFWQEAVVEDAETGEILTRDMASLKELPPEVLIYKSPQARESWAVNGAILENKNLMIHVIRGVDSMTVVVDEPGTPEMAALLDAIRKFVYQDIFWMPAYAA